MIPLPDELDMAIFEDRAIATLWPHVTDRDRYFLSHTICAGEIDCALADCIHDCYAVGYRIPEDLLQELEEYADVWPGNPDFELMKRYIARVRSLDDHPAPTKA